MAQSQNQCESYRDEVRQLQDRVKDFNSHTLTLKNQLEMSQSKVKDVDGLERKLKSLESTIDRMRLDVLEKTREVEILNENIQFLSQPTEKHHSVHSTQTANPTSFNSLDGTPMDSTTSIPPPLSTHSDPTLHSTPLQSKNDMQMLEASVFSLTSPTSLRLSSTTLLPSTTKSPSVFQSPTQELENRVVRELEATRLQVNKYEELIREKFAHFGDLETHAQHQPHLIVNDSSQPNKDDGTEGKDFSSTEDHHSDADSNQVVSGWR